MRCTCTGGGLRRGKEQRHDYANGQRKHPIPFRFHVSS
jgi:hypothetical protein